MAIISVILRHYRIPPFGQIAGDLVGHSLFRQCCPEHFQAAIEAEQYPVDLAWIENAVLAAKMKIEK